MQTMNVKISAALAVLALAAASHARIAQAQTMTPAPVVSPALAPRLIAPHNIPFVPGDAPPLAVDHATWTAAHGTWQSSTEDGLLQTRATFSGLIPGGHYSLFSRHATKDSMLIAPLDRSGTTNSFVASPDGSAVTTVTLSQPVVKGDDILLVYHADAADHPKTIGHLGVDAYIQLRLVQP
jgi:hypothetical protein